MSWGNIEDFQGFDYDSEPVESQCTAWQISIIESLLVNANLDQKEKDLIGAGICRYSEEEATEVINYLKENNVETNPQKQWEQNIKRL